LANNDGFKEIVNNIYDHLGNERSKLAISPTEMKNPGASSWVSKISP
jgi:hypothetical protein